MKSRSRIGASVVSVLIMVVVLVAVALVLVVSLSKTSKMASAPCSACLHGAHALPVSEMSPEDLAREAASVEQEIQAARKAVAATRPEVRTLQADMQRAQLAYMKHINSLPAVNELAPRREAARVTLTDLVKQREALEAELQTSPGSADLAGRKTALDAAIAKAEAAANALHREVGEAKRKAGETDPATRALAAELSAATETMRQKINATPAVAELLARKSQINARRRELLESAAESAEPTIEE